MVHTTEDDLQPIAALNDLLFCERRCAMHHIEGVWVDSAYTLEGTLSHQRAHKPVTWESGAGVREVHGMWLKSVRLKLVGKADVVEFHPTVCPDCRPEPGTDARPDAIDPTRRAGPTEIPYPVEYKLGKRRKWDNDDVQLCAQAVCLEEMLGIEVPRGAIFHVKSKRRREVQFTPELRAKTEAAAVRLHELVAAGITPPPVLKPQCRHCSLHSLCMPESLSRTEDMRRYVQTIFQP